MHIFLKGKKIVKKFVHGCRGDNDNDNDDENGYVMMMMMIVIMVNMLM